MLEVQVEDRDATTTPLPHLLMRGALRALGLVIHHKLTTATQGGGGQESDLGSVCPSPCIVPQRVGSHSATLTGAASLLLYSLLGPNPENS